MFDLHIDANREATIWSIFIILFIYLWTTISNRRLIWSSTVLTNRDTKWGKHIGLLFGVIFLQIFALTRGDYYHYGEYVQHYKPLYETHMEEFYVWLIGIVGGNYLLWRIIIWGGALLLTHLTVIRLNVNSVYTFYFLLVCFIFNFNYARYTLGVAIYLYGLSYLIKPCRYKILGYVLGLALIYVSHYLHNSMYILIILTPFLFVKLKPIWIVFFVAIAYYITSFLQDIAPTMFSYFNTDDEVLENRWDIYVTMAEYGRKGIGERFHDYLMYSSYYILFAMNSWIILKEQKERIETHVFLLFKILFAIILMATVLGVAIDAPIFFYRTLYMSATPLCMIASYLYVKGFFPIKWIRFILIFSMVCVSYEYLYNIYLKLI